MIGFLALAFPLLLLVFMLAMERVESPLRRESQETQVQEFLESATAADVERYVTEGVAGAIAARRRRSSLRLPRRRHSN
ncbi:MAG: hypothetical protein ACR2F6_14625 [Mycobacteriales bacterium]